MSKVNLLYHIQFFQLLVRNSRWKISFLNFLNSKGSHFLCIVFSSETIVAGHTWDIGLTNNVHSVSIYFVAAR